MLPFCVQPPFGSLYTRPCGASGKELPCQCRRCKRRRFYPWVGRIPWRRAWQPTHISVLAWRIPLTEEPGRLQSIGAQRVGHNGASKHNITANTTALNSTYLLPQSFWGSGAWAWLSWVSQGCTHMSWLGDSFLAPVTWAAFSFSWALN